MRNFFARYRLLTGYFLVIIFLVLAMPSTARLITGFLTTLLGEFIRTWASGYIQKDRVLATDGPYSFVRNPLYLGSFFVGLGIGIAGGWIWVVIFLIFYVIFYGNLILYEEEKLEKIFGEEFIEYKKRVPRIIPDLRKVNFGGEYDFSLAMKKHREWQTWVGIFLIFVVLLIKSFFARGSLWIR